MSEIDQEMQDQSPGAAAVELQEMPEELINEVKKYIDIQRKVRISSYPSAGTEAFLIDRKWVQSWKEYANYKAIKKGEKAPQYDPQNKPGPCTNEKIIKNTNGILVDKEDEDDYRNVNLAENQRQNIEFKIINKDLWELFKSTYGGTPIKRYYRSQSQYSSFTQVELKLLTYRILFLPSYEGFNAERISEEHFMYMAKSDKLSDLKKRLGKLMKQNDIMQVKSQPDSAFDEEKSLRVYMMDFRDDREKLIKWCQDKNIAELPIKPDDKENENNTGIEFFGECQEHYLDQTLDNLQVSIHDYLVIEIAKKDQFIFKYEKNVQVWHGKCEYCYKQNVLRVQCACKQVKYCNNQCMKNDERFHTDKCTAQLQVDTKELRFEADAEAQMGLCGLQNLGNTCFMNSSLQCLSNCWPLTKYFLESRFLHELNEQNVLGTEGKLVKQFALFLAGLWYDNKKVFSPWNLKKIIGKYQPMFSGFAQHDSQELLNFVLDALHEDLNRVKKKPYIENPDSDGRPDDIVSYESWQNHLRRNQSVIVDLMHGQYKSTLNCPQCSKTSITFDPFMSLQLPIPTNESVLLNFYFVFYDMKQTPLSCSIQIQTEDSIVTIRKKIAQLLNIDPFSFVIAQISDNEIKKLVNRNHSYDMFKKSFNIHYFAMEIKPDVFEKQRDSQLYQPLEDLISAVDNVLGSDRSDDDNNNGVSRQWVKMFVRSEIMMKVSQYYSSFQKKPNTFPRVHWVNLDWSLKDVHFEVFKFFRGIINNILGSISESKDENISSYISDYNLQKYEEMTDQELFTKLFKFVDGSGPDENNWLYDLRVVNHNGNLYYQPECPICQSNKCQNCNLPYNNTKVQELFKLYYGDSQANSQEDQSMGSTSVAEGDEENKSEEKVERNNAYYFKEKQKSYGYGYGGYGGQSSQTRVQENRQKDLELEIFWNYNYIEEKLLTKWMNKCNQHDKFESTKQAFESRESTSVKLQDCFERFRTPEQLAADNTWYCSNCKEHIQAYKKLEIYRVPPILVISLKRFKSASGYFNEKVGDKVDFPISDLDMSKFSLKNEDGDMIYDLIGVSNHYGSMSFGHYTAFAFNHHHQDWYEFDDSSVSQTSPAKVCTEAAYSLFYKRRGWYDDGKVDYEAIRQKLAPEYAEEQKKIDDDLAQSLAELDNDKEKPKVNDNDATNDERGAATVGAVGGNDQVDMVVDNGSQIVETGGPNYDFGEEQDD